MCAQVRVALASQLARSAVLPLSPQPLRAPSDRRPRLPPTVQPAAQRMGGSRLVVSPTRGPGASSPLRPPPLKSSQGWSQTPLRSGCRPWPDTMTLAAKASRSAEASCESGQMRAGRNEGSGLPGMQHAEACREQRRERLGLLRPDFTFANLTPRSS